MDRHFDKVSETKKTKEVTNPPKLQQLESEARPQSTQNSRHDVTTNAKPSLEQSVDSESEKFEEVDHTLNWFLENPYLKNSEGVSSFDGTSTIEVEMDGNCGSDQPEKTDYMKNLLLGSPKVTEPIYPASYYDNSSVDVEMPEDTTNEKTEYKQDFNSSKNPQEPSKNSVVKELEKPVEKLGPKKVSSKESL